jgi:gliding motility-associated-like protein
VVVSTNNDTTVLCPGDAVDLLVVNATGGNGVYTYLWTYSTGATLATTATVPGVLVNDTATYTVQVEDQCGNTGTDDIIVYTPHWEPYQLFVANDTAICLDQSTTIWAYATGGAGGYVFDWTNPGGNDMQYLITPGLPDTYPVTVTDQCGYSLSDAVFVDVQWVDAAFIINYTDEYDVTFFNLSSPNCTQYLWDFGDGDESTAMHTAHHYIDTEDHDVWLTVWNDLGCVDSTSLLVQPPAHLYMPNAFSPDGDGVNDLFGPGGHDLYEFEMMIFDRWGEMIYSTEDPAKPWDGTMNGTPATNDVYVWKLKARGRRFGPVEYIGSVALVR